MDKINELRLGLETAYIDGSVASDSFYCPQFVSNNYKSGKKVLSSIEDELLRCDKFQISVAFITMSGITPLLQTFKDLEKKNIPGEILTTNYLNFSEPKALEKLNGLSNITLKMYDVQEADEGFHTKGYIFKTDEVYRIIIGSSNITSAALTSNHEWNTKLVSTQQGKFVYYASKGITLNKRTFKKNLGFLLDNGKYNMLAQLMSDNSGIPIRFAIFKGKDKTSTMYSVREFGNTCLLMSLDKVLEYGGVLNVPQADERERIVERKEIPLFDEEAFREAMINAFVHNQWTTGNAPMITAFSDRIEILSRGTIPPGQTMEGFFAGESVPVNQKLSDMLLQLHISERTGRGVPKITEVYGKGTYEFRENSIVVSIPFTRVSTEDEDPRWTQDRTQDGTQEDSKGSSEDEKIKRILEFCQTPKGILEITEMLGYSGRKPTKKYVKPLVEQGRLAMTIPDKPQSKNQKYVTVK